jgi:hypothetical protein
MTRPKPPASVGKPLDLAPEQLDQAAEVTPVDVAHARALWQTHAPARFVDLLDAAPIQADG